MATTYGNARTHCANLQQVSRSQAESTRSATTVRRRYDEAGPSRPQNMTTLGRTTRPDAVLRSKERKFIEEALRLSSNVFDRLGRSRGEDMCTHLEVKCTLATSRRREDLPVIYPINDEINELRARLEKWEARNIEAAQSTSNSPFSPEIQQAPLPVGFRMPTMATYEGNSYDQPLRPSGFLQ